eukprot:scaffold48464_cov58-Cyclotella_meneghiniana.AAC.1
MPLCPLSDSESRLVEMLPVDGFQSGQCIIIHHTHNESLEWSSSSGWGVMVQLLAYFGMKGWNRCATLSTANTAQKSAGGDASSGWIPIWT